MGGLEAVKPLWEHQEIAKTRALALGSFGFFHDPGTGKTRTTIETLRGLYAKEQRLMKTLIVGPPIVIENWAREIAKYSKCGPDVVKLIGDGKKRLKTFHEHCTSAKIFVTNYESLLMKDLADAIAAYRPEVIIWDEVHYLKSPKSARFKVAVKLADRATHRFGLTGTAILNSITDLFSQMRVIDGGETFGKSFFVFRARYLYDANAGMPKERHHPDWQIRPGALEEVERLLKKYTSVVSKEDCLDLPPLVLKRVPVELSAEQRKHYKELERDFITYIGTRACVADLAITKALRMQQVVSGFMPMNDDNETEIVPFKKNPRLDALREILEGIAHDHKVLIWACFKENYRAIRRVCEGLGLRFVEVHGAVSASKKQAAVDEFNNDPACRVFIGHPLSGGIGINLVAASYSIFYSRNFSRGQDVQATARNYRGGSEIHEKITRIDLVTEGTIDETILEAIINKQSISDAVLLGIKP